MTSEPSERTGASPRLLRRRTSDRVLGGVAGGLGDYFNVDPLLIRIGFVGLMLFGGAGLVLYVAGWLLIPAEGQDASSVEAFLGRLGLTPRRIAWIAIALIAIVLIANIPIGGPLDGSGTVFIGPLPGMNPAGLWALLIIVTGVVLLRRRDPSRAAAGLDAATGMAAAPAVIAPPRAPAPPRPRSPLAWYACGAVLLGVGLLALVSQVADVAVAPGQFFGAALAILGIALVVGAWWGRARILIVIALLLVPLAVAASFMTAPLEGGIGAMRFNPANVVELRDEYRIMGGELVLDLTDLSIAAKPVHIAASVAAGQLVVIVPPDASVELRARVGAGQVTVFDSYHDEIILTNAGTSLDEHYVRRRDVGPTYILDLLGGIGDVFVTNSSVNW
jgi:phage shock protein PspC (stress-responsive transcriptional regulator)